MTRSERLLGILQELRGRRIPLPAAALADRFGVSERTVYRDVATLNGQGAVIEGGSGLGYVLRDDLFLPPLSFDACEAAALMLGLRFVSRRGDNALIEAARSAHGKLAAVLPERFGDEAAYGNSLVAAPSSTERGEMLAVARDALARERKLRIAYLDLEGRRTRRTVWPVVLGWFDDLEMMGAWCEEREAFRNFRIDRIESAKIVEERPPRTRRSLLADYRRVEPGIQV